MTRLPVLTRRFRRLTASTVSWLERAQHLLSNRWLIILVAHYYERDTQRQLDGASIESNLEHLSKQCHVMPLAEALRRLEEGKPLPRRAVSLVVDDAALPFYEAGWPILRDSGAVPFSLGVIPGMIRADTTEHLVSRIMYAITSITEEERRAAMLARASAWLGDATEGSEQPLERLFGTIRGRDRDDLEALAAHLEAPDEAYMTWDQLADLRSTGLVDLVPHSMSHPEFRHVTGAWLEWELARPAEILRAHTHEAADTFVFPYGNPRWVTEQVRASLRRHGYRYGLVTTPGITTPRSDRFLLPRVNAEVSPEDFRRNVDPFRRPFAGLGRTGSAQDVLSPKRAAVKE